MLLCAGFNVVGAGSIAAGLDRPEYCLHLDADLPCGTRAPVRPRRYGLEHVDTSAHRALATEAALQGFVLLQNNGGALPLKPTARLAVLGPNIVGAGTWQLGNYHERAVPAGVLVSPCAGLQQAGAAAASAESADVGAHVADVGAHVAGLVTCVQPDGCTIGGNASCFNAQSAAAIAAADAVVLFVGLDGSLEVGFQARSRALFILEFLFLGLLCRAVLNLVTL
jgi:hypothetical protein